jgi:hypothetical protein
MTTKHMKTGVSYRRLKKIGKVGGEGKVGSAFN